MNIEMSYDLSQDENIAPTDIVNNIPVTEKSILKPSNLDNLILLKTPIPKHLKVSFAKTPAPEVSPSRYKDIIVLDEEENWVERTSVLTKQTHITYLQHATEILDDLIHSLPISESQPEVEADSDQDMDDNTNYDTPPSSPPLPAKGGYTIDWDNFDENADPSKSKTGMGNSPPPLPNPASADTAPLSKLSNKDFNENTPESSMNEDLAKDEEKSNKVVAAAKKSPRKKGDSPRKNAKKSKTPIEVEDHVNNGQGDYLHVESQAEQISQDTFTSEKKKDADECKPVSVSPAEENFESAEEEEEEFRPATEVFSDPSAWDMLEKFGSGDTSEPSALTRQSLYVKFDPLVKSQAQTIMTAPTPVNQNSRLTELMEENDDLLLMNTPEKTPARPVEVEKEDVANCTVDRLFDYSPGAAGQTDKHSRSASPIASTCEEIVKVCNYSESDLEQLKKNLELDFQSRMLAKERDWDRKMKEKDTVLAVTKDQNDKLLASNVQMKKIVDEYEKTISQLIADNENKSSASQDSLSDLIKERDQALTDLNSVEKAFSDLHRRYEKLKEVVEGFKKNEETLKSCVEDYQGRVKKWEQKYQALKQHAEKKLDIANEEIEKLKKSYGSDNARLQAGIKKYELQLDSLEAALEQKTKENKELAAICDELISKVGMDS